MSFRESMKSFWGYYSVTIKDHRLLPLVMVVNVLASSTAIFGNLYLYSKILDAITMGKYREAFYLSLFLILAVRLGMGCLVQATEQIISVWSNTSGDEMQEKLSRKMMDMEYQRAEDGKTREFIRALRLHEQRYGGSGYIISTTMYMLREAAASIYALAFVVMLFWKVPAGEKGFFNSWYSGALLAVCYAVLFSLSYRMQKKVSAKSIELDQSLMKGNAVFNYAHQNVMDYRNGKDIRIFHLYPMVEKMIRSIGLDQIETWSFWNGKYQAGITCLMQAVTALAYVYVGGKAMSGAISIGSVLMYAGAINQLSTSVAGCIRLYGECVNRMFYMGKLKEFLNTPDMEYDGTLPVEKRDDARYEICFEDVTFTYPGTQKPALDHVSLKFEIGSRTALVGKNGSGKTTLIKLLCRLYEPDSGRILLNGVDIRYFEYKEYVQLFSVVFQDFHLFAYPIGENIAGSKQVDEERAWDALEKAGMKERVMEMEDKLNTLLYKNTGEGVEISGGEAQKLALARALYKDAPFVILDEPTAALDPLAEAEVYEHFKEIVRDRTSIYISHRMSSCKFCDEILVLDEGKIAERGTHSELLEQNGIYAGLFRTQAQYYA